MSTHACLTGFVLLAMTISLQAAALTHLSISNADSYSSLPKTARQPTEILFRGLEHLGLATGLFRTPSQGSFARELIFSKLQALPLKKIDGCAAVFCQDVELQQKINGELALGRIVLVSNAYSGFIAAVPSESEQTRELKDQLSSNKTDFQKNLLIITPKTLRSTLAHEMTHAQDNESGTLLPLFHRVQELFEKGQLSAASGKMINQFVGEVRAYDNETKFLIGNSRNDEFVADDSLLGDRPYEVSVHGVKQSEFLPRRLHEIDWKVRQIYLPQFLKGLADGKSTAEVRALILQEVSNLLPAAGPYSFAHLVQPQLH